MGEDRYLPPRFARKCDGNSDRSSIVPSDSGVKWIDGMIDPAGAMSQRIKKANHVSISLSISGPALLPSIYGVHVCMQAVAQCGLPEHLRPYSVEDGTNEPGCVKGST